MSEIPAPSLASVAMENEIPHISVCICTYKRPDLLFRLLTDIGKQETAGQFTFSIVVADNDRLQSAQELVSKFGATSSIGIKYCVQPEQNIALTRNAAIANATGDFVAFIDDDEFPAKDWLLNLLKTSDQYNSDGVLGPVKRHFDEEPPAWIVKGNFYERPEHATGYVINWRGGRTGNLLLKMDLFADGVPPFRQVFRAGEDQDFFRRMTDQGRQFVWCNEAVAYEVVPPNRWKRGYMLRKAMLRGATAVLHPTFGARDLAKSLIAIPAYTLALPFALIIGQHRFMDLLVRLFDHLGKVTQLLHINPVKEPYVSDQP